MTSPTDDIKAANLSLWNEVSRTDPDATKRFKNGSFEGTQVLPGYQWKRATALFGPCGKGWGFRIDADQYVTDAVGGDTVHEVRITFWWLDDGQRCEIPAYGCTKCAYTTKSGRRLVDEDAPKKSLTDAIGKAMTHLGFAADIYAGFHDNPAYVKQLRDDKAEQLRLRRERASTNETSNGTTNGAHK